MKTGQACADTSETHTTMQGNTTLNISGVKQLQVYCNFGATMQILSNPYSNGFPNIP
jgi:hypothetical protein